MALPQPIIKQVVTLDFNIQGSEEHLYGKIGDLDVCYISHKSKEEAEKMKDALLDLPSEYFLRPLMIVPHQDRYLLAVKHYEESLSAYILKTDIKLYQRKDIVRLIYMIFKRNLRHCFPLTL